MQDIKSIVIGISVSLLLIGFFLKLSPRGKMSKGIRHLLSMVVLLIIISPLSGGYELDLNDLGSDNSEVVSYSENDYEDRVVSNVMVLMQRDVEEYLNNEKFGYYSVDISTLQTDKGTELNEIIIHIKSGYSPENIEKSVSRKFGLPTKVVIGTE